MKQVMTKAFIMTLVKLRWAYFHINPMYIKFYVDSEGTEAHFQHKKHGTLHSNLVWVDDSCNHEKYQENMACHGICLSCGKDLGFIQPLRESNPKGETGFQDWDCNIKIKEQP